jgi:site-specific DNA recombinase
MNGVNSMVAIVYARVSSEDQARTGFSLASQVEAGQQRAADLGAGPVSVHTDEGVPGDVLERPGLQAALAEVRRGGVSHFVCFDPDRLARSLSLQLLVTEQIEQAGARLEFVNFEYRTTAEGQLFYALRGAISQYEKAKIRERTMRGKRQKARTGGLTHNPGIYGYDFDPAADRLSVNDLQAQVVRLVFRWFLDGAGPCAIARRLTALGISPARGGGAWHHGSVRNILRNRSYTGTYHQQKWDYADTRTNKYRPPGQKVARKLRPQPEWLAVTIPAIIAEATYAAVCAKLQRTPPASRAGSRKPDYLLSGVARCGLCGRAVAGARRGRLRYYVCRGYAPGVPGQPRCAFGRVRAEPLEAAVWFAVRQLVAGLGAMPMADETGGEEAALLGRQLEAARVEHARTAGLVVRGAMAPDVGEELLRGQRQRLTALEAELARRRPPRDEASGPGAAGPDLADPTLLERLPAGVRQALVRTLLHQACLTPAEAVLQTRLAPR